MQAPTDSPETVDLLITGIGELATPLGDVAVAGSALGRISVRRGVAIACSKGRIVAVGPESELRRSYAAMEELSAEGGLVIPGLVDSHTHPVFADTRESEFEARVAGKSYVQIAAEGGGIRSSLRGVRESSVEDLTLGLLGRLDRFLALGTTTLEAKTGYGLTVADELKGLDAIHAADRSHAVDLIATCLGGHDVPPEFEGRKEAWIDVVVNELWPAAQGRAAFADVFTESHVFGLADSRRMMEAARELGFGIRMHVDQLTSLGGAELAAELGAASADHLEHVSERGMRALAESGVQPVLCPMVPLFLRETQEAPARAMVEAGCAPALSTDFNPGSCYCMSLFEVMSWAALRYGFSAAEALTAATLNAAATLRLAEDRGTIEPGKRADLVLTDLPNYHHLTYELGRPPVRAVVKNGAVVFQPSALPRHF
ncbi:Imidazolonepropionase [Planctomycetes bacterium Poly30]|uniref:Imidazolonepropionase n=1 Tax=Saltatorellus ferox TaxID=2528018 RepID=A0A518EQD8_9BACT|nr:Imidazolonepropionase [Planctomycetes bacterium Poly30]